MALTGTIPENPSSHEWGNTLFKTVPTGGRLGEALLASVNGLSLNKAFTFAVRWRSFGVKGA